MPDQRPGPPAELRHQDGQRGSWYGPDLPDWVNSLREMKQGEAYWVVTR
ncbi:MAG: hypothetical protein U5Q44_13670 [Dehalococcoidia bacterium]|nr:hypothetical protein [Dehalococcoidia bacterium]